MRSRSLWTLALFAVLAVMTFGTSDASAATGSMQVTVYTQNPDKTKEMIIGGTVTLTDANKQAPDQFQITNENGQVLFPMVQVGSNYTVTVKMPGYNSPPKTGLRVVAGVTTQVTVAMLAELTETVTVSGKTKVVELDDNAESKTTVSGEEFADLPVFGRDYQAALTLAPGVQDSDGDGNPNVHGSRDVDFRMNVDGASNRDPLTGRFQSNVNPDSIEEMEIVDSGADASYGGVVGGYGRIVTKSGGNKFEGAFNIYIQDGQFNGDGAGGTDPLRVSRRQPAIVVSGPLIPDKLWYMANHEYRRQSRPVITLGGLGGTEMLTETLASDKLTWQITPKNKLQLSYRNDTAEVDPFGLNERTSPESALYLKQGGPVYNLTWTAPFSASFSWDAVFAFADLNSRVRPHNPRTINSCVSGADEDNQDFVYFRNFLCENALADRRFEGAYLDNLNTTTKVWTYKVDATKFVDRLLGGPHELKFGFAFERSQFSRDLRRRPYLQLDYGNGGKGSIIPEEGGFGGLPPSNPFLLDVTSFYFPGQDPGNQTGLFKEQRGLNKSLGNVYSAYVSDSYDPLSNLRVTFGLRATREELSSDGYEPIDVRGQQATYGAAFEQCMESDLGGGRTCRDLCGPTGGSQILCGRCLRTCTSRAISSLTIHPLDDPKLATMDPDSYDPLTSPLSCEQLAINPSLCSFFDNGRFNNPAIPTGYLDTRDTQNFSIINTNIEPRLSVRWDPNADNKTVVSAFWGRTYAGSILEPLVAENGPDAILSRFGLTASRVLNNNFGSPRPQDIGGFQSAFSIQAIERDTRMTYKDEFQFRLQREIAEETSLTVRYINNRFRDQLQDIDVNHRPVTDAEVEARDRSKIPGDPLTGQCDKVRGFWDCTGIVVPSGSGALFFPDGLPDLVVVNPAFNNIYQIGNYNTTKYEAYVLEIDRRYFHNWEMSASYVWSRSLGQAEDYNSGLGDDVTNADDEEGPLAFDQRHVVKINGRRFVDKFGGFRVGGAVTYQTGLPYSLYERRDVGDFPLDLTLGNTPAGVTRPDRTYITARTIYPTGRRNDQRNDPFWKIDVNLQKELQFGDVKTTIQVDMFNVLGDNTTVISGIERFLAASYLENGVLKRKYDYVTYAGKYFGRIFQIGLKVNF